MVAMTSKLNLKLLRDLRAMRGLVGAIALIVFVGVMVLGGTVGTVQNLRATYDYSFRRLALADLWFIVRDPVTSSMLQKVRRVPGVQVATDRVSADLPVELDHGGAGERAVGHVMILPGHERPTHPVLNDYVLTAGHEPAPERDQVLLEQKFAQAHNLQPGTELSLRGLFSSKQVRVSGLFTSPEFIVVISGRGLRQQDYAGILAPESVVDQFLRINASTSNELMVQVAETADRDKVRGLIEQAITTPDVITTQTRDAQPSYMFIQLQLSGLQQLAYFFPILFLVVAVLATYILLGRVVREQRRQIGMLRALGVAAGDIQRHYLLFALFIGILGVAPGALGALYLSDVLTQAFIQLNSAPFVVTQLPWQVTLIGVVLNLLSIGLAAWGPARQAASVPPMEALRGTTSAGRQPPLWLQSLPGWPRWPADWKLPVRNLFRQRRRTLGTAVGIIFAEILVLISATYFDSVSDVLNFEFQKMDRYDVKVGFTQPRSQETIPSRFALPEITAIAPIVEIPVRVEHGAKTYSTMIVGLPPTDLYELYDLDERPLQVTTAGGLLGSGLQKVLALSPGESVKLVTTVGDANLPVAAFIYQPHGSFIFMPLDQLYQLFTFPRHYATSALVRVAPGTSARVVEALKARDDIAFVQTVADDRASIEDQLTLFNIVVAIMAVFGAVLALAILFNTIMVNVLERRKELATMRLVGIRQSEVVRMMTLETGIGGLLGVLPGIAIGYQLATIFFTQFGGERITMLVKLSPQLYGSVVVASLLALLLAQWPGLRYIHHLNLAQVTKEQVS